MGIEAEGASDYDVAVKKPFIAVLLIIAISSCVSMKEGVPVPDPAMAAKSGEDLAVLQRGYGVYMSQCTRCHEPMMPSEVSDADWHIVTPGMAWNAGISESDESAVLKYILAAR